MASITKKLRLKIHQIAQYRCGYCLTAQEISGGRMEVEHIIPVVKGGLSTENNLWLSCAWCNSFKGTQTDGLDPLSQVKVALFNPRTQNWFDHFCWSKDGLQVIGLTSTGRVTVIVLQLNNEYILPARRHWVAAGWHPPTK